MSLVKQVEDMKSSGKGDSQIISELRNQGFMPREIEDALSQFQVKSAVSGEYGPDPSMQQSILSSPAEQIPVPSPSAGPSESYYPSQQQAPQPSDYNNQYSQGGYSTEQQYPQYSYSPVNSETVSEVAEQVFDSKISKIKSEISKLDDFRSDVDNRVNLLKERIKRIEGIIDTLQDSIIRKIGEYGENIQDLGNDLKATQDSFSKIVSPLSQRVKSRSLARKKVGVKKKKR